MELMKRIEQDTRKHIIMTLLDTQQSYVESLRTLMQLEASAGNALKLLEASSSLKIIKLEQKSQALEQELERARRRQKETEQQLAFEKTAKESFMELCQMSEKTIRSLQVDLELHS
ncbi:moesin-like [Melanerpes formicivorus]|uniref:moesin-like n=1 Tax=Melanerpes formicivorus TaxID=211600 RepID=UPI00358E6670